MHALRGQQMCWLRWFFLLQAFASGYHEANLDLDIFANSDTVFILSYAIMMLNTDLHNPCVKKHLTRPEWISMNRGKLPGPGEVACCTHPCPAAGINDGEDLPAEFLVGIYERIQKVVVTLSQFSDNLCAPTTLFPTECVHDCQGPYPRHRLP